MGSSNGNKRGFVYLVRCGEWVKIGQTKNLEKRFQIISTAIPYPVTMLHYWEVENTDGLEWYLQDLYKNVRGNGEWFQLRDEDIEQIIKMDISLMPGRSRPPLRECYQLRHFTCPTHPLTKWRVIHGLRQREVSIATDISTRQLSRIECWYSVPLGNILDRLLILTGLPTDALVRGEQFLLEHPAFDYGQCAPNFLNHHPRPTPEGS